MILKNMLFLSVMFLFAGIVFASGQYQTNDEEEKRLIKKARYFQTIEEYKDYLDHYPNGVYAVEAKKGVNGDLTEDNKIEIESKKGKNDIIAKPLFEEVLRVNDLPTCTSFIDRFPYSSYTEEVKILCDNLLWEYMKKINTIEAYQSYLLSTKQEYLGHIDDAKKEIYRLEKNSEKIFKDKIRKLEKKAKTTPGENYEDIVIIYEDLLKLDPDNPLYEEKVGHYRDLIVRKTRINISNIQDKGKWKITVNTDPIDDSKTVTLILEANTGESIWGKKVSMVVRCKSNKTDLYINWEDYLGNEAYVLTRIGSKKAKTKLWGMSTDSKTSFHPHGTINFIKDMFSSSKFVAQITPYNENPITAIFDTFGLESAIHPLRETCNW